MDRKALFYPRHPGPYRTRANLGGVLRVAVISQWTIPLGRMEVIRLINFEHVIKLARRRLRLLSVLMNVSVSCPACASSVSYLWGAPRLSGMHPHAAVPLNRNPLGIFADVLQGMVLISLCW